MTISWIFCGLMIDMFALGNKPLFEDTSRRARPKISLLDEEIEPTVLLGDEDGKERKSSESAKQKEERLFVDEEDHSELLE